MRPPSQPAAALKSWADGSGFLALRGCDFIDASGEASASALMWVTSVVRLLSRGGDGVGRYQAQVDSGYRTCLCLELNGPNSQRGDTCRFALKRLIISLTIKLLLFKPTWISLKRSADLSWPACGVFSSQKHGAAATQQIALLSKFIRPLNACCCYLRGVLPALLLFLGVCCCVWLRRSEWPFLQLECTRKNDIKRDNVVCSC